ncbi:general odorant-binding protein 19a isoform X4 [Eurosta solidaginis]|uniref:general odorant-binding protein 19a isoform X4 n=1 Tax=Eurosta solidaginis TaxID=178769 RepID=UPI0035310519
MLIVKTRVGSKLIKNRYKFDMLRKINRYVLTIVIFILILHAEQAIGSATEEQMMAAGKLMRDVCLPKFPKISAETADGIRSGNIPDQKDVKCYITCILEMMQTMKKGKFLLESSLKQVDVLMPDDYKDDYRSGLNNCKDAVNGIKNNCDAGYALLVCMRGQIKNFMFP